jgi:MFS transporter, ACS family, D-galactonate transporter
VAPIVTGYIVKETESFTATFVVAGVVLLLGIASYVLVLGRIEPIPEPDRRA